MSVSNVNVNMAKEFRSSCLWYGYWILGNHSVSPSPSTHLPHSPSKSSKQYRVCVYAHHTYRLIGWFRLYKSGACMFGLRIKRTWVILYKLHWQPFYLHTLFVSKMIVKWFIWCCVHTLCVVFVLVPRKCTRIAWFDVCQTLTSNTCSRVWTYVSASVYMDVKSIIERTA